MKSKRLTHAKIERLAAIVNEDIEPADHAENLFVEAYKSGYIGESLMSVFITLVDKHEDTSHLELECFILGYAMGQKQGDIDIDYVKNPKEDKEYH